MQEIFFKILMVGPKGAGKSSLLHYTTNCEFDPTITPTAGTDFCIKKAGRVDGVKEIKFQIWDLAGSKTFQNISKAYFSEAKACIFVVDKTRPTTFDTEGWNECLWGWETQNPNENIEFCLIALNKADLGNGIAIRNKSLRDTPLKWVKDKEIPIIETSAKTGQGIDDLFALLTNMLIYRENLKLEPKQIALKNIIYIPDSWSSEKKHNLNLMEKKEEFASQSSRELKVQAINEESEESHLGVENQEVSNVETSERISESLHNTTADKKLSEQSEEISVERESIQTKIRTQSQEVSESREDVELSIEKSQKNSEYIEESIIRDVILYDDALESLLESTRSENIVQPATSKDNLKERIIETYCPDSISFKIKQISELTFEILRKIIQQYINEENILYQNEIDRYYISSKIFSYFDKNNEAINCLNRIISIARSNTNKEWESFAATRSAEILKQGKKFEEAIDYYKKALNVYKEMNNLEMQTSTLNNIASVYYKLEEYSKALTYFKEALQVDKKLGDISSQANREYWIGAIFSKINQKQDALLHLKNALNLYNQIGRREEAEEVRSFIDNLELY